MVLIRLKIDVFVSEFKQTEGTIEVVNQIQDSYNRSKVKLTLTGNQSDPVNLHNISTDKLVAKIDANNSESIILNGEAGKQEDETVDDNGATGQFNMVFKVKKAS